MYFDTSQKITLIFTSLQTVCLLRFPYYHFLNQLDLGRIWELINQVTVA